MSLCLYPVFQFTVFSMYGGILITARAWPIFYPNNMISARIHQIILSFGIMDFNGSKQLVELKRLGKWSCNSSRMDCNRKAFCPRPC